MKKLLVITIVAINTFLFVPCFAQSWSAMDTGLYQATATASVNSILEYKGVLYAGGAFMKAGSVEPANCIAQWNGAVWDSVNQGMFGFSSHGIMPVYSLQVYNGNLIAGGGNLLLQWNGVAWSALGPNPLFFYRKGSSLSNTSICTLNIYNGNLIVGGGFDSIPGSYVNNIVYWNGSTWNTLGSGLTGIGSFSYPVSVNTLVVYNGNLYAAGHFDSAGGSPARNIAMWNGTSWSAVGTGINGGVSTLSVYNSNLYAGGYFDSAGGRSVHNIAMWDGTNWSPVGGVMSKNGYVAALTSFEGDLYAGGVFDTIGGVSANLIAYWNGSNWHAIGQGLKGYNYKAVYSIYGYNTAIYVGGSFDTAGGIPASNIAMCTNPTGINEISNSSSFNIYPNPNNGIFTLSVSHAELVSASQTTIEIYNVMGQRIYNATLKQVQGDNSIDISNQPAGIYLYRVLNMDGGLAGEGKLVIAK